MRRDSIFYQLFQQFPTLLFELLEDPPANAAAYRFDSVAVKEPTFSIDGVFLPPDDPGIVYFCEVQFQRDETLYERLFGESFLYFYRNRQRFRDWQAVVIYPSQTTEQKETHPYRALLHSDQVHRIYLDTLGDIQALPIGIALMVLTTLNEQTAPTQARSLLTKIQQENTNPTEQQAIIEMLSTIMVYKFTNLTRAEVEAMLGLSLQETRVYQEAKAEGRREERKSLVLMLLTQKLETLSQPLVECISALSLEQLEAALTLALKPTLEKQEVDRWVQEAIAQHLIHQLAEKFTLLTEEQNQTIQALSLKQLAALAKANPESLNELERFLQNVQAD